MHGPVRSFAVSAQLIAVRFLPRRGFAVALVVASMAMAPQAFGATLDWTGAQSTSWSNPENWFPNVVPTAADIVEIANDGTVSLDDMEASIGGIRVGPFHQTGGGGTLYITSAAAGLTSTGAFIAEGPGSKGEIYVSDFATWADDGLAMTIGYRGNGRVEVTRAGEFTRNSPTTFFDYSLFLGYEPDSEGTLVVDLGKVTHRGGRGIIVGKEGKGTIEVRAQSTVHNDGYLEIGREAKGDGDVSINGATWTNTADVTVGFAGVAKLTLKNDGVLSDRSGDVGPRGTATVDHAAWNNTAFFGSRGALEIKQGGVVSANQISVHGGETKINDGILIAREQMTVRGPGVVNLNSGFIHVTNQFGLTPDGNGAVVGNRTGLGRLYVESGGALNFPVSAIATIDGLDGTLASVTGDGSRWAVDGVVIGEHNYGRLGISAGGSVVPAGHSAPTISIGREATGDGILTVDSKSGTGVPAKLETKRIFLGDKGRGRLTIANGGLVLSQESVIGNRTTENFAGGEATITGAGSLWSISDKLWVGLNNTGSLKIRSGGRVEVGSSPVESKVVVGAFPALLPGTITVEHAGSALEVLGALTIGDLGVGEMQIKNQGHVDSDAAWIGYGQGSQGKVLVDNGTWLVRDLLSVGLLGNAELDIRNSGVVVAKNGVIVGPGGTLMGTGGITGDGATILVENAGTAMPGTSPGTFTIGGNYKQNSTGKLQIELASATSFDVLNVTGNAALGGALDIVLLDGFTPGPSHSFEFLKASSFTGAFSSVTVRRPTGPAGSFTLMPTPTGLSLSNYQGGGVNPDSGLIAYWNAENGAADVTGNGHDGTFQGNAATIAAGPFGKAFTLDGAGDFITIGDELDMGTSDFTLSAWVNGDPTMDQWGRIFDKGYASAYSLHKRASSSAIGFEMFVSGNGFGTTSPLIDNAWHHVALVKSGTTVTIYADGAAEGSNTVFGGAQDNALPLLIGYNPGEGTQGYWKGLLDELKIFNRALTPSEVAALALATITLPGDFNHDGAVNAADLAKWRGDFGTNAGSDADNDGDSDGQDFLIWQRHLGATQPAQAAAVPEPATLGLLMGAVATGASCRRRRSGT
jgi:T5SS/PEP-CTERM-associated repeat protein